MDVDAERGAFGSVLRRLRSAAGLSQEELANRARLSVESISALERGRRRAPYRETIRMIADALALSDAGRRELETAAKRRRTLSGASTTYDSADDSDSSASLPQLDATRHNLTRPLSTFHNRVAELDDLATLLAGHRLVSIIGPGGIGKTRLAIELAWRLLDRYHDGVWLVDLAPLDDDTVVARSLTTTLGIPIAEGRPEVDSLLHHLQGRDALLIIDNCEHVIDQVARLLETLVSACRKLRVLATSREPLHIPGERVYRIPPLASPALGSAPTAFESLGYAAVALFVDRSTAANAAFTYTDEVAAASAQICRRLDGIALAIELAASRTAVLSPQQIIVQLEDHFATLGGGGRTASPRQQTMYEAIRWSYDRLTQAEQSFFRHVALFVNGFTWDAVRALLPAIAAAQPVTLDVLAALVDKSLIVADGTKAITRYRLLEPMRAYGLARLKELDEGDHARAGMAAWCLDFAREAHVAWANGASRDWSARFGPEVDTIRGCLIWALDDGNDIELGQRIVVTSRRLWARLFPSEGRRWVDAARRFVGALTPTDIVVGLDLAKAHLDIALSQYASALSAAQRCQTALGATGDTLALAEARGFAGIALARLGRSAEGELLITAAIAVFTEVGAKQLAAFAVNALGIVNLNRDDVVVAARLFRDALSMFRDVRNDSGAAGVAVNLAELEFRAGNVDAAVRLCREASAISGSGREARIGLGNLAAYLIRLGRYDEARDLAREIITQGGIARAEIDVALALQHLAAVAVLRTDFRETAAVDTAVQAARVVGFVDARLALFETTREFTERQEYDIIVEALRRRLGADAFAEARELGQSWSEEDAVHEVLRL